MSSYELDTSDLGRVGRAARSQSTEDSLITRIRPIAEPPPQEPQARIVIAPIERRQGIIIIPDTKDEPPEIGVILAISEEGSCPYQVGEHVIFFKWAASEFEEDRHTRFIVTARDVLAITPPDANVNSIL